MSIASIVTLVSYLLLGIILISSFFIGYKRRLIRGGVSFAISIVLIIAAYLITPPISKALLGMNVSVDGVGKPLSQIIVDLVCSIGSVKTAVETSPALKTFLETLPVMIMNIVTFFAIYAIMRLLGYIVYKIIDLTCLKKIEKKENYNAKRDKWLGGCLGILKGLVFTVLAFAPLTALIGMVGDLQTETKPLYTVSEGNTAEASLPNTNTFIEENVPVEVMDAINAYNTSALGYMTQMFGLDNFIFDQLGKINVDGETVMLRQDALNGAVVYNTVSEITKAINSPEGESLKNVNWTELNKRVDSMFESGLIKGLATNLLGDFIQNYDQYKDIDLGEFKPIVDAVAVALEDEEVKEYFLNDFKQIYSIVAVAGESGILDYVLLDKTDDIEAIADNIMQDKNKESILKMVNSFLDMNVVKDAISPALELAGKKIDKSIIDLTDTSNEVSDWSRFKANVLNIAGGVVDVNSVVPILDLVKDMEGILDIPEDKVDKAFNHLGKLFDNIDQLEILRKDGKSLATQLLEKAEMGNLLSVKNEPQITTYTNLFEYLKEPVKDMLKIDLYALLNDETATTKDIMKSIATVLADDTKTVEGVTQYSNILTNIITKLYKIDGIRDKFFGEIKDMLSGVSFINLSDLDVYTGTGEDRRLDFDKSYNNWEYDLEKMTQVIVETYNTKIGTGENERSVFTALIENNENFQDVVKLIDDEKLDNIINPVIYAKSMRSLLNDMLTLIANNINAVTDKTTTLSLDGKTLIEGEKEDQGGELIGIIKALIGIIPEEGDIVFPDPDDDSVVANVTYAQIGQILDIMKENAYRVELTSTSSKKTEVGIFNQLFTDIFEYTKEEYPEIIALIGNKKPWEIKYTEIFTTLQEIEDAKKEVEFLGGLKDIVVDGDINKTKVEELIENSFDYSDIADPEEKEAKKQADEEKISSVIDNAIAGDISVDIKEEDKADIESKIDSQDISNELKDKLKEFLGITSTEGE